MRTLTSLFLLAAFAASAHATSYTFRPSDADLADLDHHYAYIWGITSTLSGTGTSYAGLKDDLAHGQTITSATLTFTNIWDWINEPNDRLWMHLLDKPKKGITTVLDNPTDVETPANDYFAGQGTLLVTPTTPGGYWTDPQGGSYSSFDLVVTFTLAQRTTLKSYITNGGATATNGYADFGFGFDADCHYYNDCIQLVINTSPATVPEGSLTIILLGFGLIGMAVIRRFIAA